MCVFFRGSFIRLENIVCFSEEKKLFCKNIDLIVNISFSKISRHNFSKGEVGRGQL